MPEIKDQTSLVKCKWCEKSAELCRSHAIPLSFFRLIYRSIDSGQLDWISTDSSKISKSQNSGAAKMLCRSCEEYFNDHFDKFADRKFSRPRGEQVSLVLQPHEVRQCAKFLISVIWRAAQSTNTLYSSLVLSPEVLDQLKFWLLSEDQTDLFSTLNIEIQHLVNGPRKLSKLPLQEMIQPLKSVVQAGTRNKFVEIRFLAVGLSFCLSTQNYSWAERKSKNIVKLGRPYVTRPINFLMLPGVLEVGSAAYHKCKAGHTTYK